MSSRPSTSAAGAPGSAVPGGSTRIPEWSVPRLSSAVEQIIPSDVRPYVLRAVMVKSPGSVVPGNATATRSPTAKLVAPQTMSRGSGFTDVDLDGADRLLELGELLDFENPADGQWAADRADGDDFLDLVADADQRLLQLVGGTSQPGAPAATTSRSQLYGSRIRRQPRTAARTARRPRPCRACRGCRCGTAACAPGPCRTRIRSRPPGRCRRRAAHSG